MGAGAGGVAGAAVVVTSAGPSAAAAGDGTKERGKGLTRPGADSNDSDDHSPSQ